MIDDYSKPFLYFYEFSFELDHFATDGTI